MDAPTSWRLCGFISQVNSRQIIAFSRLRHADLSSLSCTIPSCEFMFDVQILQNGALVPKQISAIYSTAHPTAGACMDGHNERTSPSLKCCASISSSFQWRYCACSISFTVSVHCSGACLHRINVLLQWSVCALIKSALTHSWHDWQRWGV